MSFAVTVSVDAVVYYRVSNATVSVANVENAHHSTRLLAQTTLRNILGTKNLHEILSDRESISGSMQVLYHSYLSSPTNLYSEFWCTYSRTVPYSNVQCRTPKLIVYGLLVIGLLFALK